MVGALGGMGGNVIGQAVIEIVTDSSRAQTEMSALEKTLAVGTVAAFGASILAAGRYETAIARVSKTSNLQGQALREVSNEIRGLTREVPLSATELANLTATAAQLGITGGDNLIKFTEVVAKLGTATDVVGEEGASQLARFLNVMGESTENVDRVASALVELGNNGASTEQEILELALRLGAAGRTLGLTTAQVLGLATGMKDLGINAEAGGTAMSRVILEIYAASKQGGEALENYAAVAGMTADAYQRLIEESPDEALRAFIEGLSTAEERGTNVVEVLEALSLGDVRVRDALLRLAGAQDRVNASMATGSRAYAENSALEQEFGIFAGTSAVQAQLLVNQIMDLAIGLGTALLPAANDVMSILSTLLSLFTALPEPVRTTIVVVGALAALWPVFASGAARAAGALVGASGLVQSLQAFRTASSAPGAAAASMAVFERQAVRSSAASTLLRGGVLGAGAGLTVLATQSNNATLSMAASTAQGAAMGMMFGGPWGAAIGGAIGLLVGYRSAQHEANAETAQATILSRAHALVSESSAEAVRGELAALNAKRMALAFEIAAQEAIQKSEQYSKREREAATLQLVILRRQYGELAPQIAVANKALEIFERSEAASTEAAEKMQRELDDLMSKLNGTADEAGGVADAAMRMSGQALAANVAMRILAGGVLTSAQALAALQGLIANNPIPAMQAVAEAGAKRGLYGAMTAAGQIADLARVRSSLQRDLDAANLTAGILDLSDPDGAIRKALSEISSGLDGVGGSAGAAKDPVDEIVEALAGLGERAPHTLDPLIRDLMVYRQAALDAGDATMVGLIDNLVAMQPTASQVQGAIRALQQVYGDLTKDLEKPIDLALAELDEIAARAPRTLQPLLDELRMYRDAAVEAGDATQVDLIDALLEAEPTADQVRTAIRSLQATYGDLAAAAEDAAQAQRDAAEAALEVARMVAEAQAALKQQVIRELDFIGDAITTALRRQYDAQMDAELAAIEAQRQVVEDGGAARLRQIERDNDAQLEAERDASEARIAIWEAETEAQKAAIEARTRTAIAPLQAQLDALAALDEKAKQEDYARQLSDIDRQIAITYDPRKVEELLAQKAKIQEQMAADERRRQRAQLEDQIRDIEDNARDQQRALDEQLRAREAAERESLQRREEALRESLQAQQEAARAATAAQIAALDEQTARTRDKYAALTTEYALQSEARTMILNGELDKIAALLAEYYPEWRTAGLSFGQQLIDGLRTSNVEGELRRILELMAAVNGPGVPGVNASNAQDVANAVASIARLIQGGAPQAAIDMQRKSFLDLFGFASPLAAGGLITGPTLGLLGEYPGAKLDPEVAIRDSHLRQLIREESGGGFGGGPMQIFADLYIDGRLFDSRIEARINHVNERQYRAAQLNGRF